MKTTLPEKITTVVEAKKLLRELHLNDEVFHPEDDANDLAGDPFTKEEGNKLNALMSQIYSLSDDFDPCEYLLDQPFDIIITHGLLYATGYNLGMGGKFRWSSNLSEALILQYEDIVPFNTLRNKNKWPYQLVKVPK